MENSDDNSDQDDESFYELTQTIDEESSKDNTISSLVPISPASTTDSVTSQSTSITKDILGLLQSLRNLVNAKVGNKSYLPNSPRDRANLLLDNLVDKFQEILPPGDIITINAGAQITPSLLKRFKDSNAPNSGDEVQTRSYADVVSSTKTKTLLLYPAKTSDGADSTRSSPKVIDLVKKEIRQEKFKVKNIKKIKNDGLAITTSTIDDIDKIIQEIQSIPTLKENIRPIHAEKKFPKCIVYGFKSDVTKEDIQSSLDNQLGEGKTEVLFSIQNHAGLTHWVFKVHPSKFNTLMKFKKVSVDWEIHNVREFYSVKRCTKCQALDHIRSKCPYHNTYCGHCADTHHSNDCNADFYRCINCCLSNKNYYKSFPTSHSSFDPNCPSYLMKIKSIKRNTAYNG